jgi:predicted phosphodiesterase
MRLLILSDLHANATALAAALAACEGRWDQAVCLGDLVGYGPDPNEVVDRVRRLTAAVIRGNHDKAACDPADASDFNPMARMAIEWTHRELRPDNREYVCHLAAGPAEAAGYALVHGSVRDEDEYILGPDQAAAEILASSRPVTFFGHTHYQCGFSYNGGGATALSVHPTANAGMVTLRLDPASRYFLNPGSVGQPRDGDPRAAFAIADPDGGLVEFWRVDYDIRAVQERMELASAPDPLVQRLAFGR